MEVLHAPWRIDYILGPKGPAQPGNASLFESIGQSNDDVANHVVGRGKTCYAVLNTYPYNGGHIMVVPYRLVPDLEQLTDAEMLEIMQWLRRCQRALRSVMRPDGFNIGVNLGRVAGAGIVEHLHLHVVPRWIGDSNFMPVIAGTSVLPEALRETAAKLRAALAAQDQSQP
ncbi:MAG: HIT domain-containing protein [Verrucomicrobia bacterium]|nr:MAG: HIT domain-containing protein [Verrucomicrobiota bacterium]